jgi:hypothetical protein
MKPAGVCKIAKSSRWKEIRNTVVLSRWNGRQGSSSNYFSPP